MSVVGPFISFEKTLSDTPSFRNDLSSCEKSVQSLEKQIIQTIKRGEQAMDQQHATAKSGMTLAQEIQNFASWDEDDPESVCAYTKFASCLKDIEQHRCLFIQNSQSSLINPLQEFKETVLKDFKESKKVFNKVDGELDNAYVKYANSNVKKPNEQSDNGNMLEAAKSVFAFVSLDHVHQINDALGKSRFEILEKTVAYMYSLLSFFHQSYDTLKDLEPFLQILTSSLSTRRDNFAKVEKSMERRHELISVVEQQKQDVTDKHAANIVQEVQYHESSLQVSAPGLPTSKSIEKIDSIDTSTKDKVSEVKHAGYLFAKGVNKQRNWKRYYVYIKENQIWFQMRQANSTPFGGPFLHLCTVKNCFESDRFYTFEIISPTTNITLQAEKSSEKDAWISCLQSQISQALDMQHSAPNPRINHPDSNAGGLSQEEIDAINNVEGNDICCDCSRPSPTWASINFGILLCIECSGVHRKLGVHISKVRSLTLDRWEPECLKVMKGIGNKKFNEIYLKNVPPSVHLPTVNMDRAKRTEWIVSKYSLRSYTEKADPATLAGALFEACKDEDNLIEVMNLIATGADVNCQLEEHDNWGPMHVCAHWNNTVCAELLYQNFGSLDLRDSTGKTPIHIAAALNNHDFVSYLLKRSARYDLLDDDEKTPLTLALEDEHVESITQLRIFALNATEEKSRRANLQKKSNSSSSSLHETDNEAVKLRERSSLSSPLMLHKD